MSHRSQWWVKLRRLSVDRDRSLTRPLVGHRHFAVPFAGARALTRGREYTDLQHSNRISSREFRSVRREISRMPDGSAIRRDDADGADGATVLVKTRSAVGSTVSERTSPTSPWSPPRSLGESPILEDLIELMIRVRLRSRDGPNRGRVLLGFHADGEVRARFVGERCEASASARSACCRIDGRVASPWMTGPIYASDSASTRSSSDSISSTS